MKEEQKIEIAEKVVDEKLKGNILSWLMLIAFGLAVLLIPFMIWGNTWLYFKIALTCIFISIISYAIRSVLVAAVLKVANDHLSETKSNDAHKSRFEQKLDELKQKKSDAV